MSVILQQQTFVASDWGQAIISGGSATVTQQFAFGVAVTGTLTAGSTVTAVEGNSSHTVLTLTVPSGGFGGPGDFILQDSSSTDYVFANTTLTVGSQEAATSGGISSYQAPARTLVWTGAVDTNFANAADWNDISNGITPAASAPGGADTAEFLTNGGTVTGMGTAAQLQFGGAALWNVTSGASLSASTSVTVGAGGSGSLLVNGGATISGLSASDTISGTSGGVASATVDGTGSAWKSAGELIVGNAGGGNLTISNKASLSAAAAGSAPALSLGVASGGNGVLSVTGTGSKATLVGQLDVGQAGAGTLTVSSQGTVQTGNDPGLDPSEGVDIAQATGGSGQITVTGTNSSLVNSGRFVVGDAGLGNLSILAGATVATALGGAARGGPRHREHGIRRRILGGRLRGRIGTECHRPAGCRHRGSGGLSINGGAAVTAGALDAREQRHSASVRSASAARARSLRSPARRPWRMTARACCRCCPARPSRRRR